MKVTMLVSFLKYVFGAASLLEGGLSFSPLRSVQDGFAPGRRGAM